MGQENGETLPKCFDKFIKKSSQTATYVAKVREQAERMNVHNSLRNVQERKGAEYRTYAILKAVYNINVALKDPKNEGEIGPNTTAGKPLTIGNATADDLFEFVKKFDFPGVCKNTQKLPKPHKTEKACLAAGNCKWINGPDKKYNKFWKVPISKEELETHITVAKQKLKTKLPKESATKPDRRQSKRRKKKSKIHRRRLADAACMEEKDMDAMSPSELVLHRRRLSGGARVSPVLAALMEQIEEAQRNH